jgi:hypothetical protein
MWTLYREMDLQNLNDFCKLKKFCIFSYQLIASKSICVLRISSQNFTNWTSQLSSFQLIQKCRSFVIRVLQSQPSKVFFQFFHQLLLFCVVTWESWCWMLIRWKFIDVCWKSWDCPTHSREREGDRERCNVYVIERRLLAPGREGKDSVCVLALAWKKERRDAGEERDRVGRERDRCLPRVFTGERQREKEIMPSKESKIKGWEREREK